MKNKGKTYLSFLVALILALQIIGTLPTLGQDADGDDVDDPDDSYPQDPTRWTDYWPRWRYDTVNSGETEEFGPTTLNVEWQTGLGASVHSSPVIVDDRIYINGDNYYFYCLDATNGSKIWGFNANPGRVQCTPAVLHDRVYFGTMWGDGEFYALDALTGAVIWNQTIGDVYTSSPVIFDDTIFVGTAYGDAVALSAHNGTVLWRTSVYGTMHSSPAYLNGTVYIANTALNAKTGETVWQSSLRMQSSPVIKYGRLFAQTDNGYIISLDARTGQEIWSQEVCEYGDNWNAITCTPCVSNYRVYVGIQLGTIYCFDAYNGSEIWNNTLEGSVIGSPVASGNDMVYFVAQSLYGINPKNGSVVWNDYLSSWSSTITPTIHDSHLYATWSSGMACYGGNNSLNDYDEDGVTDDTDDLPHETTQWSDSDGDGWGDKVQGNWPDMYPNDHTQWMDADDDSFGDNGLGEDPDRFHTDPAASMDTDLDGYPDEWNPGKTQADSTTNLTLDAYPYDPNRWSEDQDEPPPDIPDDTDGDTDGDGDSSPDTDDDGTPDNMDHDDDDDGMPDWWENENEFDPKDPTDANEDPDGDGDSNLVEFTQGTDPHDWNSDSNVSNIEFLIAMMMAILVMIVIILFVYVRVSRLTKQKNQIPPPRPAPVFEEIPREDSPQGPPIFEFLGLKKCSTCGNKLRYIEGDGKLYCNYCGTYK